MNAQPEPVLGIPIYTPEEMWNIAKAVLEINHAEGFSRIKHFIGQPKNAESERQMATILDDMHKPLDAAV